MRITAVVGARPNFVKMAPLVEEMSHRSGIDVRLVHTGQHYDRTLSELFFRDLGLPAPDLNLGVDVGSGPAQVAQMMERLGGVVSEDRPDLLLVVGDVNSTLAGALVAATLRIPLAHVEAGLRSFDRSMPEEINRVLTDAVSDYCFTTEPSANENLAREGVGPDRIFYVGNVMIDSLFRLRERASGSPILERLALQPGEFALLTLHRPSNVDDPGSLQTALDALEAVRRDVPVIFPVHPRTRRRLAGLPSRLLGDGAVRLLEPLPYLDFVKLMESSACVLTDSGGVQEETTALGVPCLTLRTTTERPITVSQGTNEVVGVDPRRVATAWRRIRGGGWPAGRLPELWDGKAASRVVEVLLDGR